MNNVTCDSFDRKSSTIDLWAYVFNDDPVFPVRRWFWLAVSLRHSDTRWQTVCPRKILLPFGPPNDKTDTCRRFRYSMCHRIHQDGISEISRSRGFVFQRTQH